MIPRFPARILVLTLLLLITAGTVALGLKPQAGTRTSPGSFLQPTAFLDYTAADQTVNKYGTFGMLKLMDVEFPDPPMFEWSGIWTHVALSKSSNMKYLVEIGLRKLKYNSLIWIYTYKQVFVTYWDQNRNQKVTIVLVDGIPLGYFYSVRVSRVSGNVWVLGIYSDAGNTRSSTIIRSKDTYATYIVKSQLEFVAPQNIIQEPSGTTVNHVSWLFWDWWGGYVGYDGICALNGNLNIDFSWGSIHYRSWVK